METSIPCETCGTPTTMTDTKRCDGCYEVEARLGLYLTSPNGRAFARGLLREYKNEARADAIAREKAEQDLCERGIKKCADVCNFFGSKAKKSEVS